MLKPHKSQTDVDQQNGGIKRSKGNFPADSTKFLKNRPANYRKNASWL
jgi:hypothetical protein